MGASQFVSAQEAQKSVPEMQKPQIEAEAQSVEITVNNSNAHVKNAAGKVLEIYNLAGVKVLNVKIDSDIKTIELGNLQKGCYILKVDKTARKIYIK